MSGLSSPLSALSPRYDVVIIGSGYGGAISASILSRCMKADGSPVSVCVLERGKEIPTGSFPKTPAQGFAELQVEGRGQKFGDADALFTVHAGPDISVIHGCGLGGTSLINANVVLRPHPKVWEDERWPKALRDDVEAGLVEDCMARVETNLGVHRYPDAKELDKFRALRAGAQAFEVPATVGRPPLAVTFEKRVNAFGVTQDPCNGCGDCTSGCNVGAKNTLTKNYLPDAKDHGAQIFCRIQVSHFEQAGDGWRVYFHPIGSGREVYDAPELFLHADVVILAAGVVGSSEILLRSKRKGLSCSNRVGHGFSANGDMIGFAYNTSKPVHGIGLGSRSLSEGPGPCVTGIIDRRDDPDAKIPFAIEEGVIPAVVAGVLPAAMACLASVIGRENFDGFLEEARELVRVGESFLPGGAERGAMQNTVTFLVMSEDDSGGKIRLDDDRVELHWPGAGQSEPGASQPKPQYAWINEQLEIIAKGLGGTFIPNPLFNRLFGYDLITVHPLGGCPMAEAAEDGVVDHSGRVFSSPVNGNTYSSLYVADGSIVPRSIGINPLLTISALADRNARKLAEAQKWKPSENPAAPNAKKPQPLPSTTLQVSERMSGDIVVQSITGGVSTSCTMIVNLYVDDLDATLKNCTLPAAVVGTVDVPALSRAPMLATGGEFALFVADPHKPGAARITYRLPLQSVEGRRYFFDGHKEIHDDPGFDIWDDATTLFVSIYEGDAPAGTKIAGGQIRISWRDLMGQLRTMIATGPGGEPRPDAAADYRFLFLKQLWERYGITG